MNIGYARVSTGDQTLHLQLDTLRAAGRERVFEETASGAKAERLILKEVFLYLRPGDTLVVWRLDRPPDRDCHRAGGAEDRLPEPQ